MKYKKEFLIFLVLFVCGTALHAQSSVNSCGAHAAGSKGSLSYTIGQITPISAKGNEGEFSQGIQQPYEIETLYGIDDGINVDLALSVYPNPTPKGVTLKVYDSDIQNLSYQLISSSGEVLQKSKLVSDQTSISMNSYSFGIYILKVSDEKRDIKAFKIIKK